MQIAINNLKKIYDGHTILDIESFFLENVGTLAIVGPSGGGKSTLLKLLATIEKADSGTLAVNGVSVLEAETQKTYLNQIGYVFQNNNLFPHLSILDNMTLHLIHTHHIPKSTAIAKAENWLKRVDILEHKNKKPHEISGGQAQRAAIVRSLVSGASLLMLDEPTSALDPKLAYEVMQTLIEIKAHSDIIVVTHELNFARRFADYYLFIEDSKIISHGPIEKLFSEELPTVKHFVNMIEFK